MIKKTSVVKKGRGSTPATSAPKKSKKPSAPATGPSSVPKTTTGAIDDLLREDVAGREVSPDRLALINKHVTDLATLIVKNGVMASEIGQNEKEILRLKNEVLPSLMDEAQVPKLAMEDGTTIERLDEVFGSVSKANAPAATDWLAKNGYASIIKFGIKIDVDQGDVKLQKKIKAILDKARVGYEEASGVHPQTLKAFIRESVESGRKLPSAFSVHIQPTVKVSFPKSK